MKQKVVTVPTMDRVTFALGSKYVNNAQHSETFIYTIGFTYGLDHRNNVDITLDSVSYRQQIEFFNNHPVQNEDGHWVSFAVGINGDSVMAHELGGTDKPTGHYFDQRMVCL